MNEENVEAGRENPIGNPDPEPDQELLVDVAIMKLMGFRFEVEAIDDFIKIWPNEVSVPDGTNWLTGPRFSRSTDESLTLLKSLKVETEFFDKDADHWAEIEIAWGDNNLRVKTAVTTSKSMAAALALLSALYIYRLDQETKSQVT
jgi:hypothetical protein